MSESFIIISFLLGIALMVIEIYTPGGILGTIGFIMISISVYYAFQLTDIYFALVLILISIILIPGVLYYGYKRILLKPTISSRIIKNEGLDLIGKKGKVLSDLKPIGYILIDGVKFEAYSEDRNIILKGQEIVIKRIYNNTIFVDKI